MDLTEALRRRRMVRSFDGRPVDAAVVDRLADAARRSPSAGHSQGLDLVVLVGAETAAYWDVTLPPLRRNAFGWPGLLRAPLLMVVVVDPGTYVARYAEADKAGAGDGLGEGAAGWPVPFWFVDAGAAIQNVLLSAVDAGLGACLFGLFDHEEAVRRALGVPPGRRLVAAIAVGHGDGQDRPGRSAGRRRRRTGEIVHRGRW